LIDQALSDMQKQNEEAAEQREEQLRVQEELHDQAIKNGDYARRAEKILEDALKTGQMFDEGSTFFQTLHKGEKWGVLTKEAYKEKMEELKKAFLGAADYKDGNGGVIPDNTPTNIIDPPTTLPRASTDPKDYDKVDYQAEINKVVAEFGKGTISLSEAATRIKAYETARNAKLNSKKPGTDMTYREYGEKQGWKNLEDSGTSIYDGFLASVNKKGSQYYYNLEDGILADVLWKKLKDAGWTNCTVDEFYEKNGFTSLITKIPWGAKLRMYKTGGLADFTGPAWLDGTKSHPELVLNARDTENFILLKDALSKAVNSGLSGSSDNGGDNYFDITIEVEEIGNDYDVDQMAARIKQQIYEDSAYRNVNAINFLR
jgi:hypothetical protein